MILAGAGTGDLAAGELRLVVVAAAGVLVEISISNCVSRAHSSPRMVSNSTSPESVGYNEQLIYVLKKQKLKVTVVVYNLKVAASNTVQYIYLFDMNFNVTLFYVVKDNVCKSTPNCYTKTN